MPNVPWLEKTKCCSRPIVQPCKAQSLIPRPLHWQLDVSFHEDNLRLRRGRAAENMSIMMRTALSLPKREKTVRRGIATKRKRAGWDTTYLTKVLTSRDT